MSSEVVGDLRAWAEGACGLEAAVELLARVYGGQFSNPGLPWVIRAPSGRFVLDVDVGEIVDGLDRDILAVVISAIAHAGGGHETGPGLHLTPDGGITLTDLEPICPWPGRVSTTGTGNPQ